MEGLSPSAAVGVELAPLPGGSAGHEQVFVKVSLGFAWVEDLGDGRLKLACPSCTYPLVEGWGGSTLATCGSCFHESRFPSRDVRKYKLTAQRLHEWVELHTDPLTPLVLTVPLYSHLARFHREAYQRGVRSSLIPPKPLLLDDEEAMKRLKKLCEAYSGPV